MKRYRVAQLEDVEPTKCPCGLARRAFVAEPDGVASVHLVDIQGAAERHYHKKLTEIYVALEGEGRVELDGEDVPIKPLTAVVIKPGCRHRAIGRMKLLNIVVPRFDPADEWPAQEG